MIGTKIEGWRIEAEIGRGATADVYRAVDENGRAAALKILRSDSDEHIRERFLREAGRVSRIDHPNVLKIYTTGATEDGLPFMAMELAHAGSLRDRLRQRIRHSPAQILWMMAQAAEGLKAARSHGIVHMDVKPGNLLLDKEENIKICDFGAGRSIFTEKATSKGIIGTPAYIAPEVALHRPGDHRSDIYSLGATMYELLTGATPFRAKTMKEVLELHISGEPIPPRARNPQLPLEIDELVLRCLEKDPMQRYQEYDELASEIQRVRLLCISHDHGAFVEENTSGPAQKKRVENRLPWPAVAIAVTLFIAAGAMAAHLFIGATPDIQPPATDDDVLEQTAAKLLEAAEMTEQRIDSYTDE